MKYSFCFILLFLFLSVQGYGQYILTQYDEYVYMSWLHQPFDMEDVDNDYYLDITLGFNKDIYGNHNHLYVLRNDGVPEFWNYTDYTTNSNYFIKELAYGNLRNSSDRDLVAVYEDRTEVMWNINNSLLLQQNNLPGGEFHSLGKISDDIYEDLALFDESEIKIFRNNASGTFYISPHQIISEQPVYMQLVDLQNSQSYYDLVTLVYDEEESGLLKIRKNVSGQFTSSTTINLGGYVQKVIMGDVNYDDYPDLIVVKNDHKLRIYINQDGTIPGNYTYEITGTYFDDYVQNIAIGDMNNDGWNDLVLVRFEGMVGIWINQKTGNLFTGSPQQTTDYTVIYGQTHTVKLADIENTGGLSVLYTCNGGTLGGDMFRLIVFKHDGNPAPAPPKNLYLTGLPGEHPTLNWDRNKERDFDHYEVWRYRSAFDYEYIRIASNVTDLYYVDTEVTIAPSGQQTPANSVKYKVKAVDNINQASDFSNEVTTYEPGSTIKSVGELNLSKTLLPTTMVLNANYPNPFNPTTIIRFGLPTDRNVQLTIYSITGEKVAVLVNGFMEKGFHQVRWNGKNQSGNPVSSGIYIYELVADNLRLTRKMLLSK